MADLFPKPIRRPRKDITGQKFGRWTVLAFAGDSFWRCVCECGNEHTIRGNHLKGGHSKSCGCWKVEESSERLSLKLAGQTFGRLVAVEQVGTNARHNNMWRCKCECGAETTVAATRLKTGYTQSCGCLQKDRTTTHGRSKTRVYGIWSHMWQRCTNPNDAEMWANYGGRGIAVCDRWREFENFYADMGEPPAGCSLDRINNDGNYEPTNCRWATQKQQLGNTRRNKTVTVNGVKMLLTHAIDMLRATAK